MKLEYSRYNLIFEKSANIKSCKNSSSGNRVVVWGHTDRQS